jgi:hypothetical protein
MGIVKLRRTVWAVTLWVMLVSILAPHVHAAWECEGRTCSTSPWACCCDSQQAGKDSKCARPAQMPPSASCGSECGCELTIEAPHFMCEAALPSPAPIIYAPALLPQPPAVFVPLPSERIARAIEYRGPPPARYLTSPTQLRAPPAL